MLKPVLAACFSKGSSFRHKWSFTGTGSLAVDLSGSEPGFPAVDADTPFLTFSVSKAFTAMAVMRLVEEGKLELDAPIAHYWPEFVQGGKERATLRHTLLNQAGIPAPHLKRQIFLWPFWSLVARNVAHERALFPPGTQTAYHLVNFGFILGEVVRRVTGQPIDIFLRQTFFEPWYGRTEMQASLLLSPAAACRANPKTPNAEQTCPMRYGTVEKLKL